MANHPHRNWRRRWTVDVTASEARHESGVVVRFSQRQGTEIWGDFVAGNLASLNPADRARLLREAKEMYAAATTSG